MFLSVKGTASDRIVWELLVDDFDLLYGRIDAARCFFLQNRDANHTSFTGPKPGKPSVKASAASKAALRGVCPPSSVSPHVPELHRQI